jgi:serine phosphatase RsbU (regulator of sigma subunit)
VAILETIDVVAETAPRDRDQSRPPPNAADALDSIADAGRRIATSDTLADALAVLTDAVAGAAAADVAVARVRQGADGFLVARAVSATSPAVAAELEGSRLDLPSVPNDETAGLESLPPTLADAGRRAGATAALVLPVRIGDEPAATLELLRAGEPFGEKERLIARVAAAHLALAVRAFAYDEDDAALPRSRALELLGDALATGADENEAGVRLARLATLATRARSALLWLADEARGPVWVGSHGTVEATLELEHIAQEALADRTTARLDPVEGGTLATIRLGEPPLGVLQLVFTAGCAPTQAELARLATLGVRAAQSLRSGERARVLALELDRTRALLGVLGQAIAQLSLTHTVETAAERVAELLAVDRVAVYLLEDGRLEAAATRSLAGPHATVAQRLLELVRGPYRARGVLTIPNAGIERGLAPVSDALAESEIESVIAVPLRGHDELDGLLIAYPPRGRAVLPGETSLLAALAAQLSVAVQNARLHERAKRLGTELEQALISERRAARQLRALYEISGSFVEHFSLEPILTAVAQTVVNTFGVDAAAIRMVDRRRDALVTRAVHIASSAPAEPLRTLLARPQPLEEVGASLDPSIQPVVLGAEAAERQDGENALLAPFLRKGSTAAVVPVATKTELLATLTVLSLDPERPITDEITAAARTVAAQTALAIDNARLYQQQKEFAETMQRSLLADEEPELDGYELRHVYESSAHMDIGGDVYDFLLLDDGRLALILGDVTGHGIAATADMAMAKFVFRTLVRRHPEPGDFLARANEVLLGEMELGRFITMACLLFDFERGEVVSASAGHPPPRLVTPDGTVVPLAASGLALGVEPGQAYDETTTPMEPGAAVVLYTDAVVEARQNGVLYGSERLDEVLRAERGRAAAELARLVVDDCRAYGGGDLADDCAVVVVKRHP